MLKKILGYKDFHFDYFKRRKLYYIISLLVILPGLFIAIFFGMNQGLDFTGGSIMEITYDQSVDLADVRDIVNRETAQNPSVNVTDEGRFIIRTSAMEESENVALTAALSELGEVTVLRSELIGPLVGAEILRNARNALLIAGILMLLYITLRFKLNYALTAIIGLVHDVLVIISVFAIFRIEIDQSFIAAILTVVGYSINNTIVIYDRIRENTGLMSTKIDNIALINASINQTLTRNINTVLAVLFLLLCLLFFGGETTKNFIFAMTVGITAGFYSSIFLIGGFLNALTNRFGGTLGGSRKKTISVKNKKSASA